MAAVFKKVLHSKSWRQSSKQKNPATPQCPPSPDLSGLTEDEVTALREVFKRQELFEQEETERIKKIKDELEEFETNSSQDNNGKTKHKHIDLRLCRLCHKTKFVDGIGRLCCDCHKRVCNQCGSFSPPRWDQRKNKNAQGRWRCNVCNKRRDMFFRTGEWHPAHRPLQTTNLTVREKLDQGELLSTSPDSEDIAESDLNVRTSLEDFEETKASPDREDVTYHEPIHRRHHRRSLSTEETLIKPEVESSENGNDTRHIQETQSKIKRTRRRTAKNHLSRHHVDRSSFKKDTQNADSDSGSNDKNNQHKTIFQTGSMIKGLQERKEKHHPRRSRLMSVSSDDLSTRRGDNHCNNLDISDNSSDSGCIQETRKCRNTRDEECALSVSGMNRIQRQDAMYFSSSSSIVSDTRSADPSSHSPSSIMMRESTGSSGSLPQLPECQHAEVFLVKQVAPSIHVTSQFSERDDHMQSSEHRSPVNQRRPHELSKLSKNHLSPKRHISPKRSKLINQKSTARRMTLPRCEQILLQNPEARRSSIEGDKPREILLHRDKTDRSCRASGLGIRVIGGKIQNGSLCAHVASVVTNGPAYVQGIREGDQVLQWNGRSLLNATFEEAREIMDQSCDVVQLLVIHKHDVSTEKDKTPRKLTRAETVDVPNAADAKAIEVGVQPFSLTRPKRRMLPKTPLQIKKCERKINGRIEIQLVYVACNKSLKMNIIQAEMLSETAECTGREPNPIAMIHILPSRNALLSCETETLFNTSFPKWNQTFVFEDIDENEISTKSLEITLWNNRELEDQFLGEVLLDMSDAHLDDRPVWYNLEDHDDNSSPLPQRRKSFPFSSDISTATSAATSSIGLSPSPNREASPSTTSISHPYSHLSRSTDNSPFLPGKRRDKHDHSSSGQSSPAISPESLQDVTVRVAYRGSFTDKLKRTVSHAVHKVSSNLSLGTHKRSYDSDVDCGALRRCSDEGKVGKIKGSVSPLNRHSASGSVNFEMLAPPFPLSRTNSFSSFFTDDHDSDLNDDTCPDQINVSCKMVPDGDDDVSVIGPGQVKPKPSQERAVQGDLKLGFMVSKGQLEVDVICAKSLNKIVCALPPDTYVKTYLVEGSKIIQKKKTHVVKSSFNPMYRRKIKYSACNIHGRYMRVNIWARIRNFDRKTCLGEALVKLDALDLSQHTMGWYKLFQMGSMDLGSCESLNFW